MIRAETKPGVLAVNSCTHVMICIASLLPSLYDLNIPCYRGEFDIFGYDEIHKAEYHSLTESCPTIYRGACVKLGGKVSNNTPRTEGQRPAAERLASVGICFTLEKSLFQGYSVMLCQQAFYLDFATHCHGADNGAACPKVSIKIKTVTANMTARSSTA
jgi:hypothetical protein